MKIILSLLFLILSACATTGNNSHLGRSVIYADHKEAGMVTSLSKGTKTGTACAFNICGIIGLGDSSIEAAKKEGGIQEVVSFDHTYTKVLGFYGKHCVIVKGN